MLMFFHREEMSVDALIDAMQGWVGLFEFCISMLCILIAWRLSREAFHHTFNHHPERYNYFWPYALLRLVLPVSAVVLLLGSALVWKGLLHHRPHVLLVFAAILAWLGLIRLLTGIVREILPRGRFERRTENLIASLLWLAFVAWATQLDDWVIDWMESISFRIGRTRLDLSMVVGALLWVSAIMFVALWVSRLVEKRLMGLAELDLSLRLVFSKLARTGLMVAAVLIALPIVGIDLTVLSVFGGALGVGLGLGLQNIARSYLSGFIILLDRSIRIGDRLMIGDRVGNVTKITSRFVVLKGGDGSEALIPNETMIATMVINQSYSDKKVWNSVKVDVAYGTDLELALKLVEEAAQHPRVVEPGARGFVTLFGASGITLEVGFWVIDPENGFLGLKSDIHLAIWRSFREHGIQMPFPQMEVSVKQLPGKEAV